MEIAQEARRTAPHPWRLTIASLLPLWLVSVAIMLEGFPRPPISVAVGVASLVIAVAGSLVLMWKGRMTIELLVYSLFPLLLLPIFDEISTTYKTPFIILCALILTVGALAYQWSRATRLGRGLMLLAVGGGRKERLLSRKHWPIFGSAALKGHYEHKL